MESYPRTYNLAEVDEIANLNDEIFTILFP